MSYEVYYFHRGYHSKRYKDENMALDAFRRIPAIYSPNLKKLCD